MLLRTTGCIVLLLVTLVAPRSADTEPLAAPVDQTVPLVWKANEHPMFVHHGPRRVFQPGENEVAGIAITYTEGKRHPTISWKVGEKTRTRNLNKPKGLALPIGATPKQKLFVFPDVLGRWHHAPGACLRFQVQGIAFDIFDGDHDGSWFEEGEDFIRRVGDQHAVPIRKPHVVEDWTLTFRGFDLKGKKLDVTIAPIDAELHEEEREVLVALNRERERMGFLGAISLPEYARPLRLHAEYMAHHKKVQHHEDPGTEGYTPEGNAAGNSSVILTHQERVDIATYIDIDSPIHGHVLTMPEFVQTGVGAVRAEKRGAIYGGIWTMEKGGFKHARIDSVQWPQVWPPHMATGVPRSWTREGEDPRPPQDRKKEQGYPIRVYLTPGLIETAKVTDLKISLCEQGKADAPLDCFVIAPEHPLGYEPSPFLRHLLEWLKPIFVLPRPVLKRDTWYVLRIEGVMGGKPLLHTTAFQTGNLRGQYRDLRVGDPSATR